MMSGRIGQALLGAGQRLAQEFRDGARVCSGLEVRSRPLCLHSFAHAADSKPAA